MLPCVIFISFFENCRKIVHTLGLCFLYVSDDFQSIEKHSIFSIFFTLTLTSDQGHLLGIERSRQGKSTYVIELGSRSLLMTQNVIWNIWTWVTKWPWPWPRGLGGSICCARGPLTWSGVSLSRRLLRESVSFFEFEALFLATGSNDGRILGIS